MSDEKPTDRPAATGSKRKERVIHTRVPEALDDQIRQRAAKLGMSVSNLVRNILRHTLGLVEDAISDGASVARSARAAVERPLIGDVPRPDTQSVVGWQTVVLNLNAVCFSCNTILQRGTEAALAVVTGGSGGPPSVLCLPCLDAVRAREPAPTEPAIPEGDDQ